jgi:hypothetical protein
VEFIIKEKEIRVVLWDTFKSCFTNFNHLVAFLFGGFFCLWQFFTDDPKQRIIYGCTVYFVGFSVYYIYSSLISIGMFLASKQRLNPYGEAIKKLSSAFRIIHQLDRSKKREFTLVLRHLETFCSQVKEAFDAISNCSCSVSVKIHVEDSSSPDDPRVITLCRDVSCTLNSNREPRSTATKHYVSKNSCYQHFYINVGKKKGQYFIHNDIVMDLEYKNTSFLWYGDSPNSSKEEVRNAEWPLPYKSELVVPIKLLEEQDNSSLIGFLCIDFPERNVIIENYDAPMAIGIAEGIYDILLKYKNSGIFNN